MIFTIEFLTSLRETMTSAPCSHYSNYSYSLDTNVSHKKLSVKSGDFKLVDLGSIAKGQAIQLSSTEDVLVEFTQGVATSSIITKLFVFQVSEDNGFSTLLITNNGTEDAVVDLLLLGNYS